MTATKVLAVLGMPCAGFLNVWLLGGSAPQWAAFYGAALTVGLIATAVRHVRWRLDGVRAEGWDAGFREGTDTRRKLPRGRR